MSWITFADWIADKYLLEVSELFNRSGYNDLFNAEIDRLLARVDDPSVRRELEDAKQMDWVSYISSSLRRSGVQEADLDALTSELVFKLLIDPGGLFKRWNGAPIIARFKTSVRNGVINLAEKRRTRRRRFGTGGAVPEEIPAQELPSDQAVEAFRRFVWERLGELGLAILDLRLSSSSGNTKELVATASDLVAFETKFDISVAKLEKEVRWTHICFLAWHVDKRTAGTKLEFDDWLESVAEVGFGETKK